MPESRFSELHKFASTTPLSLEEACAAWEKLKATRVPRPLPWYKWPFYFAISKVIRCTPQEAFNLLSDEPS